MKQKTKGTNAERELIHLLWGKGWAAVRVAGSGSGHYPSPDLLAGNGVRRLAIECKSTGEIKKYLTKEEVGDLIAFSARFGAEPWIGLRFNKTKWLFVPVAELQETDLHYAIDIEGAKQRGLLLEELIS